MSLPVRFSHLRAYGRSALHGKFAREQEAKQTGAMQRGTAVDAIIFGTRRVIAYPGAVRRGKEYDAFVENNPDTEILTVNEYNKAARMADAVRDSKIAAPYLKGVSQETILFKWMGLECRSTADVRGDGFLTELKTAATADPLRFGWHALRMHYHAQMRLQNIAIEDTAKDCFVVVVESEPPHPVQVFRFEDRALIAGEKLLTLWAERLKQAEAAKEYPPYTSCVMPIDIPDDDEYNLVFEPEEEHA